MKKTIHKTEHKVTPCVEKMHCSKCKAELEYTGRKLASNPPRYVHTCPECGENSWLPVIYPNVVYKNIWGKKIL